ncbi:tetratricopeptide repeat protein [Dawidia soli]|uniref:Uncharacterized protein n=1 Tax=Dawidia soli TaxID=2782352 RepID=A0AAP2D894_9BACT|nr:hypothetical protein [Dawidia soli]MBT1687286.1 hypothetical protein [Dawidia soli]
MKHLRLSLLVLLLSGISLSTIAQGDRYTSAMQPHIHTVYTVDTVPSLQNAVNAFERIGAAEKTRWEPHYYAAFGCVMMMNHEQDKLQKDRYLDQAEKALAQATALVPQESEVVALEGFIYMMRLSIDPAARGQKYAALASQTFGRAVALNPENPRALALQAQMQYGMAQFFGSPTTEACATARAAMEKFATFRAVSPLAPQWGQSLAEKLQGACKE